MFRRHPINPQLQLRDFARPENVGVYLAGKNRLGHFESCVVSYAATINDRLLNAHTSCQFTQLFPAAVNHAEMNATWCSKADSSASEFSLPRSSVALPESLITKV